MAHAKVSDLSDLEILLDETRKRNILKEKSFGCFYYKSKGVLHFHINKDKRRFAHVFQKPDWVEVDLKESLSASEQKKIVNKIFKILSL